MTGISSDLTLEAIRGEIDAIDDQMLTLLETRIAASDKVRQVKGRSSGLQASPIRPAREALILRRLLACKSDRVSAELVVRLWRAILTSSTLAQAAVTVQIPGSIYGAPALRTLIADHFCAMPIAPQPGVAELVQHLSRNPSDIGVVAPSSDWTDACSYGLQVMGRIPFLTGENMPQLLILGHCEPQPTGDDETLVAGPWPLPATLRDKVRWHCSSGGGKIAAIEGFLASPPSPAWTIAGRYPSSFRARP